MKNSEKKLVKKDLSDIIKNEFGGSCVKFISEIQGLNFPIFLFRVKDFGNEGDHLAVCQRTRVGSLKESSILIAISSTLPHKREFFNTLIHELVHATNNSHFKYLFANNESEEVFAHSLDSILSSRSNDFKKIEREFFK